MKLPIDVKAVIEAATDIESARNTPVSVSVLIDDSAPGDVAAHVRTAFVGAGAHARVTVGYFEGPAFSPYENDDMAVIVAGLSDEVGKRAADIRAEACGRYGERLRQPHPRRRSGRTRGVGRVRAGRIRRSGGRRFCGLGGRLRGFV